MEKKTTVGKSKSSNSAIISRIYRGDKKSSSNNELNPLLMKKRGVYVEDTLKPGTDLVLQKPPKRRRPAQKKSTAGTQYPEKDNSDRLKPRSRQKTETDMSRNTKNKSIVLNNVQKENEEVIIIKSKKNRIPQSPSMFSDRSTDEFKWSAVTQEPNKNLIKFALENNISLEEAEDVTKDFLKMKRKKNMIQDQATSEIDTDKRIYNFFVDLLETTFNIYNVQEGVDYETTDCKNRLEVDESVAQKLVIKNESLSKDQKNYTNEMDTEKLLFLENFKKKILDANISVQKITQVKPKITKSYSYPRKQSSVKSKSCDFPKESFYRKPKQKLLNILKEQITKHVFTCEEPQNLYQALKIMAKNKKRCKITKHYDENNAFEKFDKKTCMFRRKVLFKSKKKNSKPDPKTPKSGSRSFKINSNKKKSSYHSLEVYGYDYKKPLKRQIAIPVEKKNNIWLQVLSVKESDLYCSTLEFSEVSV